MENKKNRWLDLQIVFATLALTFSLALWNLFSAGSRSDQNTRISSRQRVTLSPSVEQPSSRIYLGGSAPQPPSSSAPAPLTLTGSSRP